MRISDWSSDVCSSDLKSHMVATWAAWIITKHPDVTILYVSATAELAETQLYAIKNILGSSVYRRYFPEYIHPQEGKRERWSCNKLSVDHPRSEEHTSELQSLMRISYAVFCLKKKKKM